MHTQHRNFLFELIKQTTTITCTCKCLYSFFTKLIITNDRVRISVSFGIDPAAAKIIRYFNISIWDKLNIRIISPKNQIMESDPKKHPFFSKWPARKNNEMLFRIMITKPKCWEDLKKIALKKQLFNMKKIHVQPSLNNSSVMYRNNKTNLTGIS